MPSRGTSNKRSQPKYTPSLSISDPTARSEHEEILLQFFALHRYATPYDIQDVFPLLFDWHQKVMRHLNWMANVGYLDRHDYKDGYLFNMVEDGFVRCRDFESIELTSIPYEYDSPDGAHIEHDLLITKMAIALYRAVRRQQNIRILEDGRYMLGSQHTWKDERTGKKYNPFANFTPDYWYMFRDEDGSMIRFVEVFVGENSGTVIQRKMKEYEAWGQSPVGQEFLRRLYRKWGALEPEPDFELHCIVDAEGWKHTDPWKERMTMMQTFHVGPWLQGRVWTATKERVDQKLAEGLGIDDQIWNRGFDLLGLRRKEWIETREKGKRTRLMDGYMRELKQHFLFTRV